MLQCFGTSIKVIAEAKCERSLFVLVCYLKEKITNQFSWLWEDKIEKFFPSFKTNI